MVLHILRALFVLLMAAVGWRYITEPHTQTGTYSWLALAVAISLSVLIISIDILASRKKLSIFAGVFFGLLVGILITSALSLVTPLILTQYEAMSGELLPAEKQAITNYVNLFVGVITCYLSISFVLQTKDDFRFIIPYVEFSKQTKGARPILLDTNVLIDGRISDVARSGILESQLIVPRFVIQELQTKFADNGDKLKRDRGRRGLDTLEELKNNERVELRDYDSSGRDHDKLPVDEQLLLVAKDLNARVLTNDFNLGKVASLRGVDVINLNELANAMKPVVLPGERMVVKLVKPGEQAGQGVGYLDDGTMVVVEQARQHLNEEVELVVTNLRQTSAGKMIFGRMTGESANGGSAAGAPAVGAPSGQRGATRQRSESQSHA